MDKENKEDLHLNDLFTGTVMEKVDKTIKYIQKNAGAISLIFTVALALGSVIIKFIFYLLALGYSYYFGISKELIDVSRGNIIYGFFAYGAIALFVVMLNFIPYSMLKSNMKIFKKLIYLILLIIVTAIILTLICYIYDSLQGVKYGIYDIILMVASAIITSIVLFSIGISFFFIKRFLYNDKEKYKKTPKKEKTNKKTKVSFFTKARVFVIFIVVCVVLESVFIIFVGWTNAMGLNKFKVLDSLSEDTVYAVVYETSDSFIITKCEIDEEKNTINFVERARKKEIDKKGVEYTVKTLTQVKG